MAEEERKKERKKEGKKRERKKETKLGFEDERPSECRYTTYIRQMRA